MSLADRLHAQDVYFEDSEPLSTNLNTGSEESLPIYSPRDSTLFFVRTLFAENTGGLLSGQDIWYSKRQGDGTWSAPKNDLDKLNNPGNNAVVGISQSGKTFYLLNDYTDAKQQLPGLSLTFNRDGLEWEQPKGISIPGLENKQGISYSMYVTPSEDILLISAQMPDSQGEEDLYVSFKDPFSNEWSAPKNLGSAINTGGYEMSPYLSEDQRSLYFSSNGHPGYGNADIFVSYRQDTSWTNWSRPKNLGEQINSASFDAYFSTNAAGEVFFVSDRQGNSADIYTSRMLTASEREAQVAEASQKGTLDDDSSPLVTEADRESRALTDEAQALLDEFNTIRDGSSAVDTTENLQTDNENTEDRTLGKVLFELNAFAVRDNFKGMLNNIVTQMQTDPRLKIEVVGHADDTGGKDYNLKLSIDRAIAVKQYLVNRGVNARRIITYGKGATQPLSSQATNEARQRNRRVEINFI